MPNRDIICKAYGFLLVMSISACAGPDDYYGTVAFAVTNGHTNSVDLDGSYAVNGDIDDDPFFRGETQGIFAAGVRLDSGEKTTVEDVFSARSGTAFTIDVTVRSGEEDRIFLLEQTIPDSVGRVECALEYKRDLLTASFIISHSCIQDALVDAPEG